jgi:hypothetical protein
MKCRQAEQWMDALLDGELAESRLAVAREGLRRHCAGCARCQAQWETLRTAESALRAPRPVSPPPGILLDLRHRLAEESGLRPSRRPARAPLGWLVPAGGFAAVCAAGALFFGPLGHLLSPPPPVASGMGTGVAIAPTHPAGPTPDPNRTAMGGPVRPDGPAVTAPERDPGARATPTPDVPGAAGVDPGRLAHRESASPTRDPFAGSPDAPGGTHPDATPEAPGVENFEGLERIAPGVSPSLLAALQKPIDAKYRRVELAAVLPELTAKAHVIINQERDFAFVPVTVSEKRKPLWKVLQSVARSANLVISPKGDEILLRAADASSDPGAAAARPPSGGSQGAYPSPGAISAAIARQVRLHPARRKEAVDPAVWSPEWGSLPQARFDPALIRNAGAALRKQRAEHMRLERESRTGEAVPDSVRPR